jgi:hypothetical protein
MSDGITEARRGTYFSGKKYTGTPEEIEAQRKKDMLDYYNRVLKTIPIEIIRDFLTEKSTIDAIDFADWLYKNQWVVMSVTDKEVIRRKEGTQERLLTSDLYKIYKNL